MSKYEYLTRDKLEEHTSRLANILEHFLSEKTGVYFICGETGAKDDMGLPEHILVCPQYGLDGFAMYSKKADYSAPGW